MPTARHIIAFVCLGSVSISGLAGVTSMTAAPLRQTAASAASPTAEAWEVVADGLRQPVAVFYDQVDDVYLVVNQNESPESGEPGGFISRLDPDGERGDVRWIDGTAGPGILERPTGLEVFEDRLYVADGTEVRVFDRTTGAALTTIAIPEAEQLRDLDANSVGTILVTETHELLGEPHDALYEINPAGEVRTRYRLVPATPTEIIVPAPDAAGTIIVESWTDEFQHRIRASDEIVTLLDRLPSAATIGYDARRQVLLIPDAAGNRVVAVPTLPL